MALEWAIYAEDATVLERTFIFDEVALGIGGEKLLVCREVFDRKRRGRHGISHFYGGAGRALRCAFCPNCIGGDHKLLLPK
jgi:hypothetical protein